MEFLFRRIVFNVAPVLVVGVMVYVAVFGSNGLLARHRVLAELAREERKLEEIQAENARLRREVRELRGDATTLQRAAAEDLQLVPPGSTVYRFP